MNYWADDFYGNYYNSYLYSKPKYGYYDDILDRYLGSGSYMNKYTSLLDEILKSKHYGDSTHEVRTTGGSTLKSKTEEPKTEQPRTEQTNTETNTQQSTKDETKDTSDGFFKPIDDILKAVDRIVGQALISTNGNDIDVKVENDNVVVYSKCYTMEDGKFVEKTPSQLKDLGIDLSKLGKIGGLDFGKCFQSLLQKDTSTSHNETSHNEKCEKEKETKKDQSGCVTDIFGNWVPIELHKVFTFCVDNKYPDVENHPYTHNDVVKTLLTTSINTNDVQAFEFLLKHFEIEYEFYNYLVKRCENRDNKDFHNCIQKYSQVKIL